MKLSPNERLLVESGINHFRVVGPGLVWLAPWQRARARLFIGPQGQSIRLNEVRTREDIPVNVTIQVLYRVNPDLFGEELLPKLPALNAGGWQGMLQWRTEAILRPLLAGYPWRGLNSEELQQRLEQQLGLTLADRLKKVGLDLLSVSLVKTELDPALQQTIIRAERDQIEARGRALVLREYLQTFGPNLPYAMPHIVQWELLNLLHKNGQTQFLLSAAGLTPGGPVSEAALPQPVLQFKLPLERVEDRN